MLNGVTSVKRFKPGTTGWSASDLRDPDVESQWVRGRYEIVERMLTEMLAAYFSGAKRLYIVRPYSPDWRYRWRRCGRSDAEYAPIGSAPTRIQRRHSWPSTEKRRPTR